MRLEYPCWSSESFDSETICFKQGVCDDDELSHDGGDGDFRGFSGGDELLIFGFQVRIEASSDEGGHVKRLTDVGSPSADEALAFPLAGLPGDWYEAGERCGLFAFEVSQLGHGGDQLVGRDCSDAIHADEDLVAPGELSIGCDDRGDLGIEVYKMAGDLVQALFALTFEQGSSEVFLPVFERSAISHQATASIDQFGQQYLVGTWGKGLCAMPQVLAKPLFTIPRKSSKLVLLLRRSTATHRSPWGPQCLPNLCTIS